MKKKLLTLLLIVAVVSYSANSGTHLVKKEDNVPEPNITFNLV